MSREQKTRPPRTWDQKWIETLPLNTLQEYDRLMKLRLGQSWYRPSNIERSRAARIAKELARRAGASR